MILCKFGIEGRISARLGRREDIVKIALAFVSERECVNPSLPSAVYAVTIGRD
jgi:hypothetical protein